MKTLFKNKKQSLKKALGWSFFWIFLALAFNVFIYFYQGQEKALEFLAGYLLEKSLSVDNIFVFFVIFSFFKIPPQYQNRVLFYGILAALIFRFLLILAGLAILKAFAWLIYVLGVFLLVTGFFVIFKENMVLDPRKGFIIRWVYKTFNVTNECEREKFFVKRSGSFFITPLFLALLTIEGMDLIFALDSIPAVFAITTDQMIVYTSNAFAMLGLRSVYIVLACYAKLFQSFKKGIGFILLFTGCKILLAPLYHMPTGVSIVIIIAILAITTCSCIWKSRNIA